MAGTNVVLGADNSQLKAVLKDSTGAIVLSQQQWEQALNGSAGATENLFDRMKDMKTEAVSHGRVFGFYGQQLAEVSGLARGAATEIVGLGAAMASGMYVAAAIEGLKLIVSTVREVVEEKKKEQEAWQRSYESIEKFGKPAEDRLREMALQAQGLSKAMTDAVMAMERAGTIQLPDGRKMSGNEAAVEADTQAAKARQNYERQRDMIPAVRGNTNEEEVLRFYPSLKKDLDDAKKWEEFRDKLLEKDKANREVAAKTDADATEKAAEKETETREKTAEQVQAYLLAKRTELADGERKIDLEYEAEKQAIWARSADMTQREYADELSMAEQVHQKKLAMFRQEQDLRNNKDYYAAIARSNEAGTETEGEGANFSKTPDQLVREADRGAADRQMKRAEQDRRKAVQDQKRDMQDLMYSAREMGSAFGDVFAGMADGTMTFGRAVKEMAAAVVKSILDMVIKSVEANAVNAASGAAASQASIPIVGPALAVAAMAAMQAAVMGLLTGIPGRAAGGSVWSNVPYMVGERGPELFVPQGGGTIVPNDRLGGGQTIVNHNYYSFDPQRFADLVRKANADNVRNRRS